MLILSPQNPGLLWLMFGSFLQPVEILGGQSANRVIEDCGIISFCLGELGILHTNTKAWWVN